jgi:hypothetical protein
MNTINKVFCPTDAGDKSMQKEPISMSRLAKQDAVWQDVKRALGWDYVVHSENLLVASHQKDKVTSSIWRSSQSAPPWFDQVETFD